MKSNAERYQDAIEWVAFSNREQDTAPKLPMRYPRREEVRAAAAELLHSLATCLKETSGKPKWLVWKNIELPARRPQLQLAGNHALGLELRITDVDPIADGLIPALMAGGTKFRTAVHRLRLCASCGKTFLALNGRTKDCSPACANRRYQRAAYRKRREYEKNRVFYREHGIKPRELRSLHKSLRAGDRRK